MKRKILATGVASEYVLADLCEYLRLKGWDVLEIDFDHFKGDVRNHLMQLQGSEIAYLTSAHTNLSLRVADVIAPTLRSHYPNYMSPLEIIEHINPSLSIYIPHDLLTPFGDKNLNEYRYLDLFDYILTIQEPIGLQATLGQHTKVIQSGWIKYTDANATNWRPPKKESPKIALFVSMLEHLRWRYGINGIVDYFLPLLSPGMKVKLPAWDGAEEIEGKLKEIAGVEVIPSRTSSIELILDSDLIICNGASSIHAEADLMGRPTICLLDEEGISSSDQKEKLSDFPSIYFHSYTNREPIPNHLIEELITQERNRAQSFNYHLVEDIISK